MGAFLSVSQGSAEEPVFMEMSWNNASPETEPIVLVGKGVTFDTGGISIKPSKDMDKMRADMGGAACVTGCLYSAAKLKLPINLKVLIPLCENMPSSKVRRKKSAVCLQNFYKMFVYIFSQKILAGHQTRGCIYREKWKNDSS